MNQASSGLWKYLGLAGHIGFVIAAPVVVLALTGRYLDHRFNTSPWFLLTGIILSFVVSSVILYTNVMKNLSLMEEESRKADQEKNKNSHQS